MTSPFDMLYTTRGGELHAFGDHWCGPESLSSHKMWQVVAEYPKNPPDGDGQTVHVDIMAMPARFVRLRVDGAPNNNIGEPRELFTVGFGSSQQELAAAMAEAISKGMLTFEPGEVNTQKDGS